jgi:hypothetical protein
LFRPGGIRETAAITELAEQKFGKVRDLYLQLDTKVRKNNLIVSIREICSSEHFTDFSL